MNKKINKIIKKVVLLSFMLIGMVIPVLSTAQNTICTADVTMCPNGLFVGRTGPECEFVCNDKGTSVSISNKEEIKKDRVSLIENLRKQIALLQQRIQKIIEQKVIDQGGSAFTKNLKIGSVDKYTKNEVTKLQKLLISENVYPEKIVSGYYGKLTSRAVKKLKVKYGINNYPGVEWSPKIYNAFEAKKKGNPFIGRVCTKEYRPVCGEVKPNSIMCIKAPCPSNRIIKTFSNKCMMENANAKFLYKGKCKDGQNDNITYTGEMKFLSSEKELREFLAKNKNSDKYWGTNLPFIGSSMVRDDMLLEGGDSMSVPEPVMMKSNSSTSEALSGSNDFSTTNIQVEGVDEADIVKTDGRYIYTLSQGRKITIVDAENPKEMIRVASIRADENENINSIYLYNKKLVLITNVWNNNYLYDKKIGVKEEKKALVPYESKNFTRVEVYNVNNPESPVKEKTIEFEGNLNNSRVTNGHLYLLTNKYFNFGNGNVLPIIKADGNNITSKFGAGVYYFDEPFYNTNILSINAINLNDTSDVSTKRVLMPYIGQIYVSMKNIYLTHVKYLDQNKILVRIQNEVFKDLVPISIEDRELIKKINNTDVDVMNNSEKANKIAKIYAKYEITLEKKEIERIRKEVSEKIFDEYKKLKKEFQKTKIEKFALEGTKVVPVASGSVSGTLLNQFSMNEKNGFFYIATTNNSIWLPWQLRRVIENNQAFETENNLYSLDSKLNNVGQVEGIAKGERIQSVRYVGNRAYIVTFKQIDPLFNIDISDPYKLRILGELKIPGFSQYLHPVYKNRLIGLGRDVKIDKNGNIRNAGLKVTLFDVSGDNPKEIESLYFGKEGSYSEALNNHKAVLISDKKNIMAFPATLYKNNGYDYNSRNNVVELLKISNDDISVVSELAQDNDWKGKAQRSLYIDDVIYTIAPEKIKSFEISDGNELGKIFFGDNNKDKIYPIPLTTIE